MPKVQAFDLVLFGGSGDLALRFGNSLFEPLLNRNLVRDVQITIAEQVGVEGRGNFYDRTGALRDMVQNHLLQLLCIIAMEPPTSIAADASQPTTEGII